MRRYPALLATPFLRQSAYEKNTNGYHGISRQIRLTGWHQPLRLRKYVTAVGTGESRGWAKWRNVPRRNRHPRAWNGTRQRRVRQPFQSPRLADTPRYHQAGSGVVSRSLPTASWLQRSPQRSLPPAVANL